MRISVQWSAIAMVGALAAAPAARAQQVTRDQLVGRWILSSWSQVPEGTQLVDRLMESIVTFGADSTWATRVRVNGVEDTTQYGWSPDANLKAGNWYLQGDSLWYTNPAASPGSNGERATLYRIARSGNQLIVQTPWQQRTQACTDTFAYSDPSKPLPAPSAAPVRTSMVKAADLVGTWTLSRPREVQGGTTVVDVDTVTLRADSGWTRVQHWQGVTNDRAGKIQLLPEMSADSGRWSLHPGDMFMFAQWNTKRSQSEVMDYFKTGIQGGQWVRNRGCGEEPWLYQRVSP